MLIFKMLHGSRLYGVATETSDYDYKGVYLNTLNRRVCYFRGIISMEHYFVIRYIIDGQILSYASNDNKYMETYDINMPISRKDANFPCVCTKAHNAGLFLSLGNVIIADDSCGPLIGPIKFDTCASARRFLQSTLKIKVPWVRTEGLSKNHFVILEISCQ